MSLLTEKLLTPEEEELARKQARLAELQAQPADRELELAGLRADLINFEKHDLQTFGRRYALLDELKAKIAEAIAKQNVQQAMKTGLALRFFLLDRNTSITLVGTFKTSHSCARLRREY